MELVVFYLFFCLTCVLLALAPGPDNLAAITIAASQGRKAAMRFVCGLCCGLLVHTTLVVTGVAVLIKSQAWLLLLLKLFGASYLIYLAWQSLRASRRSLLLPEQGVEQASVFKKGMLMSISNPKLLLFFLAFLPQFLRPENAGLLTESLQLLILAVLFIVTSFMVFSLLIVLVDFLKNTLLTPEKQQGVLAGLHRLAAAVFVLLALKLLI